MPLSFNMTRCKYHSWLGFYERTVHAYLVCSVRPVLTLQQLLPANYVTLSVAHSKKVILHRNFYFHLDTYVQVIQFGWIDDIVIILFLWEGCLVNILNIFTYPSTPISAYFLVLEFLSQKVFKTSCATLPRFITQSPSSTYER